MNPLELLSPRRTGKNKITWAIFCLLVFLVGCSEEAGKMTEKKPSGSENNKTKSAEALMPKALHDELMSEEEARFQGLMRINQSVQAERDKLLAELSKIDELKLALANTQEERQQILAQAEEYKTSSQAAAGARGTASAQTIQQLTVSNTQLSKDLATSKQRSAQLELSVSRIQNPANMLKIRQLTLEKEFLAKELTGREQKIQELQTSHNSSSNQENLTTIRKLKSQNASLSQSLARNEKRLKDQQAFQNKPGNPADPKLIEQLKSQNAKLSTELNKLRQKLAKPSTRPKDIVKTLAEWKIKLRNKGPINSAQLAASIGKPHDKENRTPSGDGDEAIFIWHDLVKVNLEIHTIDGKIETITYDK